MTSEPGKLPHLARRVGAPIAILLAVAGIAAALAALRIDTTDTLRHINYAAVALGLATAFVVTRLLDVAVFDVGSRLRGRTPPPALLRQIVSIVVFGIALGIVFKRTMAADLGALLTTSAIITAVIGLALQDTLGNLFAGLALAMEKTVQVGDMVRSGETLGIVEQLSWRAIKLRTLDGNLLLIPNSVAGRERLEIYPRPGPAVARSARVGIDYEAPPAAVREALEGAVRYLPGLAAVPAPRAYVKGLDEYAVHYELRYWLADYAQMLDIDSQVRERMWYALGRAGIKVAFPVIRQHQYAAGALVHPSHADAIAATIARFDLFQPLSAAERESLASGALERRYTSGETIVREGDPGDSMFLIQAGRCGVTGRGDLADSQRLALLEPGMAFGEIALLTGEPRMATVRAMAETTLVEIRKETLAPLLEGNPALVEKLDATMKGRLRHAADVFEATREGIKRVEHEPLAARIARFFGLTGRR
ncbi:MAG TPA: mechanosensitive ion channel family protein [Thermoanaerobaculia bacterium]|nr:mechanosensitive ion channel family protein [Thermoanaerobaculia bacterium]